MGDSNSSQEAYSDTTSTNASRIADQNQLNLNVDLEKNQTVRKSGSLEALQNAKIHVPKHSDGSPLDYPKLNTYTFVPTTVPPYVLEAQFDKLRLQDKGTVDGNVTDDKNLPKEFKWGQFASTIGCHSAYTLSLIHIFCRYAPWVMLLLNRRALLYYPLAYSEVSVACKVMNRAGFKDKIKK